MTRGARKWTTVWNSIGTPKFCLVRCLRDSWRAAVKMQVGRTVIHQVYPIALVPHSTVTFFELITGDNFLELFRFRVQSDSAGIRIRGPQYVHKAFF